MVAGEPSIDPVPAPRRYTPFNSPMSSVEVVLYNPAGNQIVQPIVGVVCGQASIAFWMATVSSAIPLPTAPNAASCTLRIRLVAPVTRPVPSIVKSGKEYEPAVTAMFFRVATINPSG